jgi:cystathionine beta-lyase/cystathionine gamma-synthase
MLIDPADVAICVAGEEVTGPRASAPTSTPIVQTSLFTFPNFQMLVDALSAERQHHVYTRGRNPTVEAVERKLAALERGEAAKCFASGMAAISAVMLGLLKSGDHVLFVNNTYGPTLQLAKHLQRFGIEHDVLLDLDVEGFEEALRPETRLTWLESPGTMLFRVLDIEALTAVARERGILTCIDELFYRAFLLNGGILAPFDAWLLARGLRTLPVRLRQHEADALRVAEFLNGHPAVRRVNHPAFADEVELVKKQLTGYTGLFSFDLVRDDFESVRNFIDGLEHFRIGISWGGVESLVTSPNRGSNGAQLDAQRIPHGLVRLSVGLEGSDLLIEDLTSALAGVA